MANGKKVGIFILGLVCGVVITVAVSKVIAPSVSIPNLHLFKEDGAVIPAKQITVFQTLNDGFALAYITNYPTPIYDFNKVTVLFYADKYTHPYDDMKIDIPKDKRLVQVGTYKYKTINKEYDEWKTVPVVSIR